MLPAVAVRTPFRPAHAARRAPVLASIGRRWVRAHCESCGEETEFEVSPQWTFVCTACSRERPLGANGLLGTSGARAETVGTRR